MRIAVVEDDPAQGELLQSWVEGANLECRRFDSGKAFLSAAHRESFDVVILDWGLPDVPGDEVLVELRQKLQWSSPVLFVTSRDREEDIVRALERGADDYLVKPVKKGEMLARIAALHRRAQHQSTGDGVYDFPPFRFRSRTSQVTKHATPVELTKKEFDLALHLFRNANRLLSRGHILESVWGTRADLNTRTVDTHVSRVRSKLGLNLDVGWRLRSIYQHGYRLERTGTDD